MSDVFISYSWSTEEDNELVISFVNYLREEGFDTVCDILKMQEEGSVHLTEMMAKCLTNSKNVILLLSSSYKKKADDFSGGVGSEYRYIIENIDKDPKKYILATFENINEVTLMNNVPEFLKGREIIDLKVDEKSGFTKLRSKLTGVEQYCFAEVGDRIAPIEPKQAKKFTLNSDKGKEESSDIKLFDDGTTFFDYRLSKAFPGVGGLMWFNDPKAAIDRLSIVLRYPLKSKELTDPIWFYRGASCLYINTYERVSEDKCIIDADECKINKLAVYRSNSYYRSFIYVEFKAEEPVGIYPYINQQYISERLKHSAYFNEEYAVYRGIPITRGEYDDGATVIDGQVIDLNGEAEIRIRYLTPYNMIICAKFHPFNSQSGDRMTQICLDGMLNGSVKIENLIKIAEELPKHRNG